MFPWVASRVASSVSVFGLTSLVDPDFPRSKVDRFVPHTQHVNLTEHLANPSETTRQWCTHPHPLSPSSEVRGLTSDRNPSIDLSTFNRNR